MGTSSDKGKDIALVVAQLGLLASGAWMYKSLGWVAGAVWTLGGGYALGRLVPDPPALNDPTQPPEVYWQNWIGPYAPVPRLYGSHRCYPPMACKYWVETCGDQHYYRLLYLVSYGRCGVDAAALKFADTPFSQIDGLTYEIREGYAGEDPRTLFPPLVHEQTPEIPLPELVYDNAYSGLAPDPAPWVAVGTTPIGADEFTIEISYPDGLYAYYVYTDSWNRRQACRKYIQEWFDVSISEVGQGLWHTIPGISEWSVTGNDGNPRVTGMTFTIPPAYVTENKKYDIRMRRARGCLAAAGADEMVYAANITLLRTLNWTDPVYIDKTPYPTYVCTVGVRVPVDMPASVMQFNCVAQSYLYSTVASDYILTNNPAWVWLDVLTGNANARPLALSRIDTMALEEWADTCDDREWEFNAYITSGIRVHELLQNICAVSRATWNIIDGLFTIVEDKERTTPVQHITPRTSWGFSGTRSFSGAVHGVTIQYIDELQGYLDAEHTTYADGYSASNAQYLDRIDAFGCTMWQQADDYGRYRLGQLTYQPEACSVHMDFENLRCSRGDLVRLTHDVLLVGGIPGGRVKQVVTESEYGESPGDYLGIVSDEECVMESGKVYGVRIRYQDGTEEHRQIVTNAGPQTTLLFTTPIDKAASPHPEEGNLFAFGEYGEETMDCLVTLIQPEDNLAARLDLVPYDARVYNYGSQGPYVPIITSPPTLERQAPQMPYILEVQSDETVMVRAADGSLESRIVLSITHPIAWNPVTHAPIFSPPPTSVQVQYRPTGSESGGAWSSMPTFHGAPTVVWVGPVTDGQVYDVRVRAISEHFVPSAWTTREAIEVIGKTTPPPDVTGLSLEHDVLRWGYENAPMDHAGFEIRQHRGQLPAWDSAVKIHDGLIGTTYHVLPHMHHGEMTFMVKAVDTSGNYSANAALLTVDLPQDVLENMDLILDYATLGWLAWGTLVNGTVNGSNQCVADPEAAAPFWTGDTQPFWTGDGNLFWSGQTTYKEMIWTTTGWTCFAYGFDGDPERYVMPLMTIDGDSYKLEYRTEDTLGTYTSEWMAWPGRVRDVGLWHQFRVTTARGQTQGTLSELKFALVYPDKQEVVTGLSSADPPTQITLTETFTTIQVVAVSITGNTAVSARVIDTSPTTGPKVELLNTAGNRVVGCEYTVLVKGYEEVV